jgi:hypothetical protein
MLTPFDARGPRGRRGLVERLSLLWHLWWGVRTSFVIGGTEEEFWSRVDSSTLTMTPRNLAGVLRFVAVGGGPPRLEQVFALRLGSKGSHVALRLLNDVSSQVGVIGSGVVRTDSGQSLFTLRIVLKRIHRVLVAFFLLLAVTLLVLVCTNIEHPKIISTVVLLVVAAVLALVAIAAPIMGMDSASRRARVLYEWAMNVSGGQNGRADHGNE